MTEKIVTKTICQQVFYFIFLPHSQKFSLEIFFFFMYIRHGYIVVGGLISENSLYYDVKD